MPLLPLTDWRTELLRISAFPVVGAVTRSTAWWAQVAGFPPEETNSNARTGASLVSGSFGPEGKLVLRLEPERIDWLFTPQDQEVAELLEQPDIPSLGPLVERLATFSELVEAWLALDDVPDLARIAFGAILRHDEGSRREGYLRLPEYLPVQVDPDSSDFMYQINLPVPSQSVAGLGINRLSKWSVSAFRLLSFRFTGASVTPGPVVAPEAVHALRVELDFNTAPTFPGAIPKDRLIDVYRELVRLGQQLVSEGMPDR